MPYTEHPYEVAKILADLKQDQATVLAGLLHDVVEDTDYSVDDLRDRFGQTFVIVTHDEQLASITDRTIHLRDGQIETPVIPQETCLDSETTTPSESSSL